MTKSESRANKGFGSTGYYEDISCPYDHTGPLDLDRLHATIAGRVMTDVTQSRRMKSELETLKSANLVNNPSTHSFGTVIDESTSNATLGDESNRYSWSRNLIVIENHPQRANRDLKRCNHRLVYPGSFNYNLIATLVAFILMSTLLGYTESLSEIQPSGSTLCPLSPCMCKWSNGKQDALCDRRNLPTIPTQLLSETQVLDMSGNPLGQLPPHIFKDRHLTNLQKLRLSECKISYIAVEAFAQLTNLVDLDLSHNHLQQVPTKALEYLKSSLRRLNLAFNQIHVLDQAAFSPLSHLNTLDLSHLQMSQMKPNAFSGLNELRELKLSENRLNQLPLNVLVDLRDNIMIDLYGNPWHCDCELRQSIEWMHRHQVQPSMNPTCASPPRHKDIRWQNVKPEDFICPPVIVNKQEEIVVGAGSNISLTCSARGSPPLTFVWFQDEKNITGINGSANQSEPPPTTKLLEERRYEIQEEQSSPNITTSTLFLMNLKLTDTSVFLCWVENAAGYTIGNFSLVINDSPPAHISSLGSSGSGINVIGSSLARMFGVDSSNSTSGSQVVILLSAFLLLLTGSVICLFLLKQVASGRSSKSSSHSKADLKSQQVNGKTVSAKKFVRSNEQAFANGQAFAPSDDDDASHDEDDDRSSTGASTSESQSSCAKNNNRVLAVDNLDGFIEHMRSGIINMDYHSMSPVIQFNNNSVKSSPHTDHDHKQRHQLTNLNHFQSSSNASSQPILFGGNHVNGSNSMATTLSDLSPSSGSASTSFANAHVTIPNHQYTATMASHLIGYPASTTNCDFPSHQLGLHQAMAPNFMHQGYPVDHQIYNGDPMARQMMPPLYTGPEMGSVRTQTVHMQMDQNPSTMMNYPADASTIRSDSRLNTTNLNRLSDPSMQQHQISGYQIQDSSGPFTHVL